MQILYEDNHILVVSKPAGLCTQPDLAILAKAYLKKKYQKKGNVFLEPIHRLDRVVSGLVLFARTSKALSRLQQAMRQRQIQKTYFAWVEGVLPQSEGFLEHDLIHDDYKARIVTTPHPKAKKARLFYRVLEQKNSKTHLEIDLLTGRYHQIRAQFSAIDCPIVGDTKYGSKIPQKDGHILLCHIKLSFMHPTNGQKKIFSLNDNYAEKNAAFFT